MPNEEYKTSINKELSISKEDIESKLSELSKGLPEKTQSVDIYVFVDQDGEGFITVRVSLTGPDLYVLNKEIEDKAELFDKFIPDPEGEVYNEDFIVDTVIDYLITNIDKSIIDQFTLDLSISNPEGYGTKGTIKMQNKAQ